MRIVQFGPIRREGRNDDAPANPREGAVGSSRESRALLQPIAAGRCSGALGPMGNPISIHTISRVTQMIVNTTV